MTRKETLDKAAICVCGQREEDCGAPENNFSVIGQLQEIYINNACIDKETGKAVLTPYDAAMLMTLFKIGRAITGGVKEDTFVDACGYLACAAEIVTEDSATPTNAWTGYPPWMTIKYPGEGITSTKPQDSKPTVREVNRPAEVGEWIKVVNKAGVPVEEYDNGDIGCVERISRTWPSDVYAFGGQYIERDEYVVLEGYEPAEVGEWVKVMGEIWQTTYWGGYEPGEQGGHHGTK